MGQIYFADDYFSVGTIGGPTGGSVVRSFVLTPTTALAQTGVSTSTGFLIGDTLMLTPIPAGAVIDDFLINVPEFDTGSTVTFDVGDTTIASGATSGTVASTGGFTTAALGTSQTITASASTSSFTATNALIMINGYLFGYASLSGSTFVTAYCATPNVVIPGGALIQQAGNTNIYGAVIVVASGKGVTIKPWGNLSSTTWATATAGATTLPNTYGTPLQFANPQVNPPVPTNILPHGQSFFLKIHASPGTYNNSTVPLTGFISYHYRGVTP